MISYADALALIRGAARQRRDNLVVEEVPLKDALGRVTARALTSREAIPPFDNSAMDGYALAAAKGASVPARLPVLGTIMAGDTPRCAVETGGAWRIMTGAPMPAGCDAVIPVEKTRELDGGQVELLETVESGDFVRGMGKDFPAGGEICPAGTRLGARHLLALAAVGVSKVSVRRKPRVALISTGKELVSPDAELKPGQIRDASSTYLSSAIPELGADFEFFGVVSDDPEQFRLLLEKVLAEKFDVVLTTGAVSMGDADYVPATVAAFGANVLFHKTAIRPGKPGLFALFEKGPIFFGLPGNPISTVVGLRFFVEPCLREMLGRPHEIPFRAVVTKEITKPEGLRCFFKARRTSLGSVEILPGQASFQIHSLLAADCWAILPEAGTTVPAGTEIDTYPLSDQLS